MHVPPPGLTGFANLRVPEHLRTLLRYSMRHSQRKTCGPYYDRLALPSANPPPHASWLAAGIDTWAWNSSYIVTRASGLWRIGLEGQGTVPTPHVWRPVPLHSDPSRHPSPLSHLRVLHASSHRQKQGKVASPRGALLYLNVEGPLRPRDTSTPSSALHAPTPSRSAGIFPSVSLQHHLVESPIASTPDVPAATTVCGSRAPSSQYHRTVQTPAYLHARRFASFSSSVGLSCQPPAHSSSAEAVDFHGQFSTHRTACTSSSLRILVLVAHAR
ncbi:hypothetical protein B0H13DRAFT_2411384 [Mycena leptocephala]|nr:hypothetical protein B0H13DRAFT_2411384 [Mycena leptocephala]